MGSVARFVLVSTLLVIGCGTSAPCLLYTSDAADE